MLNIALVGSHSTGKTTLVSLLQQCFAAKFYCISEVARSIISQGFPLGQDANVDSYINYVNEQLKAEKKSQEVNYDVLISDRTILDTVAYAEANRTLPRPFIPIYLIEMLENVWLLEKDFYDIYVYLPIEFEMELDGIRPADKEYRHLVDRKILELLHKNNIDYITLSGSVDARMKAISSQLFPHIPPINIGHL